MNTFGLGLWAVIKLRYYRSYKFFPTTRSNLPLLTGGTSRNRMSNRETEKKDVTVSSISYLEAPLSSQPNQRNLEVTPECGIPTEEWQDLEVACEARWWQWWVKCVEAVDGLREWERERCPPTAACGDNIVMELFTPAWGTFFREGIPTFIIRHFQFLFFATKFLRKY